MADFYVDFDNGLDSQDGSDWDNADLTLEASFTAASACDNIFVRSNATASTTPDTVAGTHNLTSPGTLLFPVKVYCCKSGTSATPPVNSDLVVKGAADMPIIEVTGNNGSIELFGSVYFYGMDFQASNRFRSVSTAARSITLERCLITIGLDDTGNWVEFDASTSGGVEIILIDTDITFDKIADAFRFQDAVSFLWQGGELKGTAPTKLVDSLIRSSGEVRFVGVDLGLVAGILVDGADLRSAGPIHFINCEVHASVTLAAAITGDPVASVHMWNCSSNTGISTSIIDYRFISGAGTIDSETTRKRDGGADDGAAGDFSWAMLPNANALDFPSRTLRSPPMSIWLDGTETTITVYIANDAAESSPANDLEDDKVWLEVLASDSGLDTAQFVLDDDRMALLGTAADQDDDTGSTWGSGANNHQKLVVTIAPGYQGWAFCYVHCAERAASPKTVYVDPLPELSS